MRESTTIEPTTVEPTTTEPTTTEPTAVPAPAPSAVVRRTGQVITGAVAAFLAFDGVIHILDIEPVRVASADLGLPPHLALTIGVIELLCLALHLVPRTSVLGAVLLTGYLGGAVAVNVRVEKPLSTVLVAVVFGILIWSGFALRNRTVRALLPLHRS